MINAIIVDDEDHAVETLNYFIETYCKDVNVCGYANSIEHALIVIKKVKPDVVFLDIKLGEDLAFSMLDQLDEIGFNIIFVTAFEGFAVKAFRHQAIDYLLKPIEPKQLIEAVEKLQVQISFKNVNPPKKKLQVDRAFEEKIKIKAGQGYMFLDTSEIIRIEGSGNYTTFFLSNGTDFIVSKKLSSIEWLLPVSCFLKVHQSHILNVEYVHKVILGGNNYVQLKDGTKLPIARRRKKEVVEFLQFK